MRLRFVILVASFLHPVAASAQEKSQRTCRILYLAAPADAPRTLFLSDGSNPQEVELPSMNLSKVYSLAAGDITLTMLATKPAADVPLPVDAPKAAVAESLQDLYLLVASDLSNKVAPVRFQVINANAHGYKNGQLLWYNLSPHRVGGKIGTETLDLAPGARGILKAPATESGDYNVMIGYVPAGTERAEPLCETVWMHDPRARNIIFVVPVAESRMPRIMGFPDFREPKVKTESP